MASRIGYMCETNQARTWRKRRNGLGIDASHSFIVTYSILISILLASSSFSEVDGSQEFSSTFKPFTDEITDGNDLETDQIRSETYTNETVCDRIASRICEDKLTSNNETSILGFRESEHEFPFWVSCSSEREATNVSVNARRITNQNVNKYIHDEGYNFMVSLARQCEPKLLELCDTYRLGLLDDDSNRCPVCLRDCIAQCGQIRSMNYPFYNPYNHSSRWSIRAPDNHYVNLTIIDFDIPCARNTSKLSACISDHLTIIDGHSGKRVGCYCNENLPPTNIVSPWEDLVIQYDTNKTAGRGFYIQYEFMKLNLKENITKLFELDSVAGGEMFTFDPNISSSAAASSALKNMTASKACSPGWLYFRSSCYKAFNELEPLQWYDAEERCNREAKGLGGHLVSILDQAEMLVIHYWLINVWKSTKNKAYYIGLIDESREGLYRWSDLNPMSYTDWEVRPMLLEDQMPAQPDGGAYEDCTVIRFNSFSSTSNWHDVPCSLGKHYHTHQDKVTRLSGGSVPHKWDYVDSYICKSDSLLAAGIKAQTQLFSNEFKPTFPVDQTALGNSLRSETSSNNSGSVTPVDVLQVTSTSQQPNNNNNNNNLNQQQHQLTSLMSQVVTLQDNESIVSHLAAGLVLDELASRSMSQPMMQSELDANRALLATFLNDNRYFICDNLEVISVVFRCDGVAHCRDSSDESRGCDPDCLDWQFRCSNGKCIPIGSYCNFVDDCGDGSDESRCERLRCTLKEFRCQSGQCIGAQQRCDLVHDCSDHSDEGKLCSIGGSCNEMTTFQCYNGNCIPKYAVCDFQIDCPGKFFEDEEVATCDEILTSRRLDYNYSYANSIDHADSPIAFYPARQRPAQGWVEQNQFKCTSGNMIDASWRCLFEFDAYDYQYGCRDVSHLIGCSDFVCPARDYVKCPNSYCIPWRYICDGKWDCIHGHDEVNCSKYTCPGQYKCANPSRSCIQLHQLCDGRRQCPMGDDEWFCDLKCPASCHCIGHSVHCSSANLTQLPANFIKRTVRKLDLSYNHLGPNLSLSDFSAYHDLGELILHHNGIEVLIPRKFHQLRNLYKLDLSNNQIHSVKRGAFAGLRRVTQLLLESNPELTTLDGEAFLGLSSLQVLNISSSRILALRKNTFDGLTALRHLLLRTNRIVEIEDGAFRSLSSLVSLDMRGNEIRHFTKYVFADLKSLRNLSTDSFKFCCLMIKQIPGDRCLPLADEISDCEDLLSSLLQRICNGVSGGVAIIGNFIVIVWRSVVLYRDRSGRKRQEEQVNSILLLSLGCSDFLMGLCQIIITIVDMEYRGRYIEVADTWRQSVLCNVCGFLSTISIEASIVTLVLIARNRWTEICQPFNSAAKFTSDFTHKIILASWSLALLIATLPLLITLLTKGHFYARSGVCLAFHITNQKAAGWLYSISDTFNLLAFVYIATCYADIYGEISRANRQNRPDVPNHPIKIALIVLTHFVACLPAVILRLMSWAGIPLPAAVYSWIAVLVLPVNSAINPMIYTVPSIINQFRQLTGLSRRSSVIARTNHQPMQERQRRAQRNVPPGYTRLRQYILQGGCQVDARKLVMVFLEIARDLEAKHKDGKIYVNLTEDQIFVSDRLSRDERVASVEPDMRKRLERHHFERDNGRIPSDSESSNSDQDREANKQTLPNNLNRLRATSQPEVLDLLAKHRRRQQSEPPPNSRNQVKSPVVVFLADYEGYRSKRYQCCGPSGTQHGHGTSLSQRRELNCECSDVKRFADILFKSIQAYNSTRKQDIPG